MIVASIRNGFKPHSLAGLISGLGCACEEGIGGLGDTVANASMYQNGQIVPSTTTIYGVSGNASTDAAAIQAALNAVGSSLSVAQVIAAGGLNGYTVGSVNSNLAASAVQQAMGYVAPPLIVSTSTGGTGIPGGNNTIIPSIGPVLQTTYSQGVQQNGQATGVVTTQSNSVAVDNPWMDFLDSTVFGIPLWLIGVGGAVAIFMGSEK